MVKQRKVSVEGRGLRFVADATMRRRWMLKGCRRKYVSHKEVLRKMLAPRRTGPISPEEMGNEPDTKDPGAAGNGSGTCARGSRTPGTCDNDDRAKEFLSTGRAGRRNALTEILGRRAETGEMLDLPERFEDLSMETDESKNGGPDPNSPGTSKQQG